MSFVVTKRPVAATKLQATVNAENGDPVEISFVAQYRRHTPKQLADLQDALTNRVRVAQGMPPLLRPDGSAAPEYPFTDDIAFIKAQLTGWLGVRDAAGDSIPFSGDALDQILADWPELVVPLYSGFFDAHKALPAAQQKN